MERSIHPAETGLFFAAMLRGFCLTDAPDGCYKVVRHVDGKAETIADRASFKEVANLCGASGRITLRQAAERDGLTWPDSPEALIAAIKKL